MLFIVGVGRSGTSLLQSMFSAHSSVVYLPETSFFRRYFTKGILESEYSKGGFNAALETLERDGFLPRTGLDPSSLLNGALAREGPLDLSLYREMVLQFAGDKTDLVGDKDPRLIESLPALRCALSDRIDVINIIRDPRDVLASKKQAAWSSKAHSWKHIFANRVQLRLGRNQGRRSLGRHYHEIIYEDLISRPQEVLSPLCQAMGIAFEDTMLSFNEAARKLVSQQEVDWKKETFGPLLVDNKEKWRSSLSAREIRLTEACCSEAMHVGGYQPCESDPHLPLLDRLWVFLGYHVIKMATIPYILYRNSSVATICKKIRSS